MVKYEGKNSSFALRLKQHRELCRLTQQQVADILNINRTTYTKYETGVSEPSHEMLKKIVSIFGTDFNTILGDESPYQKTFVQDPNLQLYNLSDEEKMLIAAYRAMPEDDKQIILGEAIKKAGRKKNKTTDEKVDTNT